jgi:hypothetical protein
MPARLGNYSCTDPSAAGSRPSSTSTVLPTMPARLGNISSGTGIALSLFLVLFLLLALLNFF